MFANGFFLLGFSVEFQRLVFVVGLLAAKICRELLIAARVAIVIIFEELRV